MEIKGVSQFADAEFTNMVHPQSAIAFDSAICRILNLAELARNGFEALALRLPGRTGVVHDFLKQYDIQRCPALNV
jgi:hypothetical protein